MLAIIDTNWFDAHDDKGQRRLDSAHDYVRIELAAALHAIFPRVALGDSMDNVKSVHHMTIDPVTSGKSLDSAFHCLAFMSFDQLGQTLENVRVDAPIESSVENVHIGDAVSGIRLRLAAPYTTPWDFGDNKAYAYRIGGRVVRFDIDDRARSRRFFQIK